MFISNLLIAFSETLYHHISKITIQLFILQINYSLMYLLKKLETASSLMKYYDLDNDKIVEAKCFIKDYLNYNKMKRFICR